MVYHPIFTTQPPGPKPLNGMLIHWTGYPNQNRAVHCPRLLAKGYPVGMEHQSEDAPVFSLPIEWIDRNKVPMFFDQSH